MTDNALNALIRARQKNVNRYCRLLATKLTDHERKYIHKRFAEERIELERLISQAAAKNAAVADVVTADASEGRGVSYSSIQGSDAQS